MAERNLTYRENSILNSVIVNFVNEASPIGSKLISKSFRNRLSPATIRNVLMNLEDKGLVIQPHISAGRIPTDLGYRYYVNDLMKIEKLKRAEIEQIDLNLKPSYNDSVDSILEKACHILSEISNQLGIILSPRFDQGIFEKLEIIRLSEHKLLIVISVYSGIVRTIMMEIKFNIHPNKVEETERILNERLSGLSLRKIRDTIKKRFNDVSYGDRKLIDQLTASANEIFTIENDSVYFKGTSNILNQPEFSDTERLKKILKLIDNKKVLVHVINSSIKEDEKISITIGKEHRDDLIRNCSLISAKFKIGDIQGTLGVIGPTRMKYERLSGIVEHMSKRINKMFK